MISFDAFNTTYTVHINNFTVQNKHQRKNIVLDYKCCVFEKVACHCAKVTGSTSQIHWFLSHAQV